MLTYNTINVFNYMRGLKHKVKGFKDEMKLSLFDDAHRKVKKYISGVVNEYLDSERLPDAEFDEMIDNARNTLKQFTDKLKRLTEKQAFEEYNRLVEGGNYVWSGEVKMT